MEGVVLRWELKEVEAYWCWRGVCWNECWDTENGMFPFASPQIPPLASPQVPPRPSPHCEMEIGKWRSSFRGLYLQGCHGLFYIGLI